MGLAPCGKFVPEVSPDHSISSSDGRCVQRAGTESAHADDVCLLEIPRSSSIFTWNYPHHGWVWRIGEPFRARRNSLCPAIVARVQPGTSKGITDLLLPLFTWVTPVIRLRSLRTSRAGAAI
jgi:hypothetical protein